MALKVWGWHAGDPNWMRMLSASTMVNVADDDVGVDPDKPRWIYLEQSGRVVQHNYDDPISKQPRCPSRPELRGKQKRPGRHLLLSLDEAKELLRYLLDAGFVSIDAEEEEITIHDDHVGKVLRQNRQYPTATNMSASDRRSLRIRERAIQNDMQIAWQATKTPVRRKRR